MILRSAALARGSCFRRVHQWIKLIGFCHVITGASRFAATFVYLCKAKAFLRSLIHDPGTQIDVFQLYMNLNILGRVNKNLSKDLNCVPHLPVAGQDLGFRDLSNHKSVVKSGGLKVEWAGRSNYVRRILFHYILHAQVIQPLKMKRLIGLQSSQLFERRDSLLIVALSHSRFDE